MPYGSIRDLFRLTQGVEIDIFTQRITDLAQAGMPIRGRLNVSGSEYESVDPLIWETCRITPEGHALAIYPERLRTEHRQVDEPAVVLSKDSCLPFRRVGLRILVADFYTWWGRKYGKNELLSASEPTAAEPQNIKELISSTKKPNPIVDNAARELLRDAIQKNDGKPISESEGLECLKDALPLLRRAHAKELIGEVGGVKNAVGRPPIIRQINSPK